MSEKNNTSKQFFQYRYLILGIFGFLLLAMLFYILFVNPKSSQYFSSNFINKNTQNKTSKTYPTLDSKLNTVINAQDPQATADETNMAMENEQIKVLIILKDDSFVFSDTYGREVLRYGKNIQALVKLNKLEELAKNDKIEKIIAPQKAVNIPKDAKIINPAR